MSRKRCPSCKIDQTYDGLVCPKCVKAGIDPNRVAQRVDRIYDLITHKTGRRMLQAKVDTQLYEQAREIAIHMGVGWTQVIEACLKKLIEEFKREKNS